MYIYIFMYLYIYVIEAAVAKQEASCILYR